MRLRLALTAVAALLISSPAAAVEPDAPDRLLTVDDLLRGTLREELARLKTAMPARDRAALQAFYEARDWRLAWASKQGLTAKGRSVTDESAGQTTTGCRPRRSSCRACRRARPPVSPMRASPRPS